MARTRYIEIPEDRPLVTISGQPVRGPDGDDMMVVHRDFVRGRTTDAHFGMRGISGVLQASEIRTQLDVGIKDNDGRWWMIDGRDYKELLVTIETPDQRTPMGWVEGLGIGCVHCFRADMEAIRDATFKPPEPDGEDSEDANEDAGSHPADEFEEILPS